jgi:Fe-S cluster biogenesis protein NfuA
MLQDGSRAVLAWLGRYLVCTHATHRDTNLWLSEDGGDVELVSVGDDGIVKVRLTGSCAGCPMSQMTLKWGVENYLKKKVPGVKTVEAI